MWIIDCCTALKPANKYKYRHKQTHTRKKLQQFCVHKITLWYSIYFGLALTIICCCFMVSNEQSFSFRFSMVCRQAHPVHDWLKRDVESVWTNYANASQISEMFFFCAWKEGRRSCGQKRMEWLIFSFFMYTWWKWTISFYYFFYSFVNTKIGRNLNEFARMEWE